MLNFTLISGQSLPEEPIDRITECAGVKLTGTCPANKIIAVKNVEYGTKLTATCSFADTSAVCCKYDSTDCFLPYTGTIPQEACTGRELCGPGSVSRTNNNSCSSDYPVGNHYLTMEYYCLPGKHFL